MGNLLALILDVVVLGALGVTVFYVLRLYKSLNEFKSHRREFDSVIANLLSSIDQAERSVNTLKQVSAKEAGELERLIAQSVALVDELKIINDAGESMAKRLEKAAETNRKIVQPASRVRHKPTAKSGDDTITSPVFQEDGEETPRASSDGYSSTLKTVKRDDDYPSFMIKDRDYDDMGALGTRLDASASNDMPRGGDVGDDIPDNLQSQAERELFEALRNTKRNLSGD